MNLRRLFRKVYGVSLPISGGCGENIKTAIKLHHTSTLEASDIEERVLDLIHDLQNYDYELVVLEMLNIRKLRYDKFTLELRCRHTSRAFYKAYYFNITGCRAVDLAFDYSSSGIKRSNK
jgi:hypothetical protein